jgi:hypothetical protein
VFTSPAIVDEAGRDRHRNLVARTDSYRLSRHVNRPSIPSWRPHLRASLRRFLQRSHARTTAQ